MKKTEPKKLDYETAYAELEQIARDLQDDRTGLDELSEKVKRAAELLDFCKKRLRATEAEVAKML